MAIISRAQSAGAQNVIVAVVGHLVNVWHDPGFRAVLKSEGWRFATAVSKEALAASQRVRG